LLKEQVAFLFVFGVHYFEDINISLGPVALLVFFEILVPAVLQVV
jgi:hypothetical protein